MATGTKRRMGEVVAVTDLGPGLGRLDIEGRDVGVGAAAGRFAMVEALGRPDCILLRPFSYFLAPHGDRISLLVKAVGKGTRGLLAARPGEPVAVLGPLGNRFAEPTGPCWAVAGGVGAAPFGMLAGLAGMRILFGSRTSAEAGFARALREEGASVELATDDGSEGHAGSVLDLLATCLEACDRPDGRDTLPRALYTCGPEPMMRAVADLTARRGVPCWVSLEAHMGCGVGVCRGCVHPDASGGLRCVCEAGPVFPAEAIFGRDERGQR